MKQIPFEEGKSFHIYNRGNNKENLFVEERNYSFFLQKMYQYLYSIVDIYSYCLMPNHFHLVLRIKEKENLPNEYQLGTKKLHQPFSNFFNSYTKAINKAYKRTGSLFQEHLHRKEITDEGYLRDVIIYTNINPVIHNFSDDFANYPYSSYKELISTGPTKLKRDKVLKLFDGRTNFICCHNKRKNQNQQKTDEIEGMEE